MPAASAQSTSTQGQRVSPSQLNMAARNLILRGGMVGGVYKPPAINVWQPQNPILPAAPGPGSVLTFQPRNVGLVKRLIVRIRGTITAGAQAASLTPWGLANIVSNVTFFDLGNNQRINTTGWHLNLLSSAKRRRVFGAAYTSDTPNGFGNINNGTGHGNTDFGVMYAPATIDADASGNFSLQLEIPFCKNDTDLRGAIYSDVTNAVMNVQVTLNPNMFVASTADPTLAAYQSAGASVPTLSNLSVQYWQNYLDQLPSMSQNGATVPILPQQDIGTAYMLTQSSSGLPVVNQDNAASFVNSRTYESVAFGYDNNGVLNVNGTDLTYVQLQSANFTNLLYLDAGMLQMMQRNVFMDDPPAALYYLDFRDRPIDTNQYGNMQLVIKPSSVGGSGAAFLYGWEAYGIIGLVNQGGSIASGG
jgi:P3 major capsid protein